jgi:hypothetical protein
MTLARILSERKSVILEQWVTRVFETYPDETVRFLREEKDTFRNPVGSVLRRELEAILDGLIFSADLEQLLPPLDAILRVRAVQDFTPSEAVGFTGQIKDVIRGKLAEVKQTDELLDDLLHLESRIDRLTLAAFDIYMACRERIAEIRIGEAKAERDRLARVVQALSQGQGSRVKGHEGKS